MPPFKTGDRRCPNSSPYRKDGERDTIDFLPLRNWSRKERCVYSGIIISWSANSILFWWSIIIVYVFPYHEISTVRLTNWSKILHPGGPPIAFKSQFQSHSLIAYPLWSLGPRSTSLLLTFGHSLVIKTGVKQSSASKIYWNGHFSPSPRLLFRGSNGGQGHNGGKMEGDKNKVAKERYS